MDVCASHLCHCNKIPYKEERFFGTWFQYMVSWFTAFGPMVRQHIMAGSA
jgi:hypothetical protein